jgi:hypothetical protein
MKKLAFIAFTAATFLAAAGAASAQGIYFGWDPGYQRYHGSRYYYGEPQYYDAPGYSYYPRGRYRRGLGNVCAPGWSLQDGLCKPYRGY